MAFFSLLEVSDDLTSYPKAVSSHLEQKVSSHYGPAMLGTVAKTGKIAAIAKVELIICIKYRTVANIPPSFSGL